MTLDVRCSNFLQGNRHVYAIKAKRKKIAIVRVEVANRDSTEAVIHWGLSKLTAGGKHYDVEEPEVVLRKFREFTWDFLLYSIIDFHPVTAVLDLSFLVTGPLYNRRLKRQLALLTVGKSSVPSGASQTALLAFRTRSEEFERLTLTEGRGTGQNEEMEFSFG